MRRPRIQFTVRWLLVVIAVVAFLTNYVVIPLWDYYQLPPKTRLVLSKLSMPVRSPSNGPVSLETVLKSIRIASTSPKDSGIPIYVDPIGLQEADVRMDSMVTMASDRMSIREMLRKSLEPLRLDSIVKDGFLMITSKTSADLAIKKNPKGARRP